MRGSCLRNKIVEFQQVSFFHAFYPAFILNFFGKGLCSVDERI